MESKLMQIVQVFSDNENAEETLRGAKTPEEAVALLGQFGVDISVDEFIQIAKEVSGEELSEDMLTLVAGGSWKGFWKGVKDFFKGFADAF